MDLEDSLEEEQALRVSLEETQGLKLSKREETRDNAIETKGDFKLIIISSWLAMLEPLRINFEKLKKGP